MEIWKDIKGFEGRYMVSNTGMVKSLKRIRKFGSQVREINERILKTACDRNGYPFIVLSDYPNKKQSMVHRLVALAFIDNPDGLPCVNHKNGIKTDNTVDNLEWVTYSENSKHYFDTIQDLDERVCMECDDEFKPKSNIQKFCSNSCKGNYRRKSGIDHVERSCKNCGTPFNAWKYSRRSFCGIKCAHSLLTPSRTGSGLR